MDKSLIFETDMASILKKIDAINPITYSKTRNYFTGAVSYLSPYISRGVISLPFIKKRVLQNGFSFYEAEKFLQELAWREYWQRVWQHKGNAIFTDIKQPQQQVVHYYIPSAIMHGKTNILVVDDAIKQLKDDGYMHNHCRMYVASINCNIAQAHWLEAAKWMYYYLLDGDLASNHLSWQWVSGSGSSKKYYCNQENINKYAGTQQQHTFLDEPYEKLVNMQIPESLKPNESFLSKTNLPTKKDIYINETMPTCIYNSYNLDPYWKSELKMNRVLLLEPSHFKEHPVSDVVLNFIQQISSNIENVQIYVGEFTEFIKEYKLNNSKIFYKEHPTTTHYTGIVEKRDWLAPNIEGYFNSFSNFWKKAKPVIQNL